MRIYFLLFVSCILMGITSCGDKNATEVDLVFQANYGNDVLIYNSQYVQSGGVAFEITRSDFFISDVRLTADDGTETTLFDYALVDFEDAPGGVKFGSLNKVDAQNYESITFGVGLNSDLNAMSPLDFEADDVLNNSGYYWSAWDSYIFSKQEGNYDSDGDGILDEGWIVHTGKDDIYQEITVPLDFEINEKNNEIRLVVDHEPLFTADGGPVEFGIIHDPANQEAFEGFYNRIRTNISVED